MCYYLCMDVTTLRALAGLTILDLTFGALVYYYRLVFLVYLLRKGREKGPFKRVLLQIFVPRRDHASGWLVGVWTVQYVVIALISLNIMPWYGLAYIILRPVAIIMLLGVVRVGDEFSYWASGYNEYTPSKKWLEKNRRKRA